MATYSLVDYAKLKTWSETATSTTPVQQSVVAERNQRLGSHLRGLLYPYLAGGGLKADLEGHVSSSQLHQHDYATRFYDHHAEDHQQCLE